MQHLNVTKWTFTYDPDNTCQIEKKISQNCWASCIHKKVKQNMPETRYKEP